jgi:hypothetical protein
MERITGRIFADQEVRLDGREFVGCNFRNCKLIYGGGLPFLLGGNEISDCNFEFVGPALNTINTLRMLQHSGMDPVVEVVMETIRAPLVGAADAPQ